jgi:hypothetical protein
LRQQVISIYAVASAALLALYLSTEEDARLPLAQLLIVGIAALTLFAASLIWAHNRAIERLIVFMRDSEHATRRDHSSARIKLFYFRADKVEDGNTARTASFHTRHRLIQKLVYVVIFTLFNGFAFKICYSIPPQRIPSGWLAVTIGLLFLSVVLLFWQEISQSLLWCLRWLCRCVNSSRVASS